MANQRWMLTIYTDGTDSQANAFSQRLAKLIEEMNKEAGANLYDMDQDWDDITNDRLEKEP
jgi:quinol monooxygenase YgiN